MPKNVADMTTTEWTAFIQKHRRNRTKYPEELVRLRQQRERSLRDKDLAAKEMVDEGRAANVRQQRKDKLTAQLKKRYLAVGGSLEDWDDAKDDIVAQALEASPLVDPSQRSRRSNRSA